MVTGATKPEASAGSPGGDAARGSRWRSIRTTAVLLFVLVSTLPVCVVALWLSGLYRDALLTGEEQLQTAVLSEVAGHALQRVDDVEADVSAVAAALELAADDAGPGALDAVRAILAARQRLAAVRFEVPDAGVSTVLRREGSREQVPSASLELRRTADERGVAFAAGLEGQAIFVVRLRQAPGAAQGYLIARVDLRPLAADLETVAEARFEGGGARLLIADEGRRAIAAWGLPSITPGSSVAALPVWRTLPEGTPWVQHVAIISEHEEDGVAMVGGVATVPRLAWAVAVWRPRELAYANLARQRSRILLAAAGSLLLALLASLVAGRTVTRPVLHLAQQARLIGVRRWRELELTTGRRDEIGDLERAMGSMAENLEQSEREIAREIQLRADLGRFMSKPLVDAIVRGEHSVALGGTRAEVSVLFADVVAFTPLAESRPAGEVVALLNELFGILSEVVFRHEGVVDKFIGDSIMAIWGAPLPQPDHAARALRAACDMLRFLDTANETWRERYGLELRIAIGVNSGEVILGNVGSEKRMEYTVIGDAVNVAARLEAIARPNQVLVGERTRELAPADFDWIDLGEQRLTGREAPAHVYALGA